MVSLLTRGLAFGRVPLFAGTDDGRFELRIVRGRGVHDDRMRFTVGACLEFSAVLWFSTLLRFSTLLCGTFYCGQLIPFRVFCGARTAEQTGYLGYRQIVCNH